jgi:hypothetical protein
VLFLIVAVTAPAVGDPIYVNPTGGNHIHSSICPALDGFNVLDPDPVAPLAAMTSEMFDELTGGDTPFPGWSYQSGIPLNGTFHIDQYQSRFTDPHVSGARINMRYVRGLGDPPAANLRWVQLIDTNAPLDPNGANPPGPPTSPYLDPYPDDADGEGGPFYYSDEKDSTFDYRRHVRGGPAHGFGADYDAHFYDFSRRPHPPTSFVEWHAQLHLTQLSAPMNVIFYEGFRWGFEAACINWRDLFGLVFGIVESDAVASYDPTTQTLEFSTTPINVLNPNGSPFGIAPEFENDLMTQGVQMVITPFQRIEDPNLPPGLALFSGGSIQVYGPFTDPIFAARIPYLVLGDDMHPGYNMTGVYGDILIPPSVPSEFLQTYEIFRQAGIGGEGVGGTASDRTSREGATTDIGTYPFEFPGHSPQFYVRSSRKIEDLLAKGGTTFVDIWNSFGPRDPRGGLDLVVHPDALSWGVLGDSVLYDVVRGDLTTLRETHGDFGASTTECVVDDGADPAVDYAPDPQAGEGFWFLLRAKRGAIVGTWDTLQQSQVGSRDPGISASAFCGS